MESEKRRSYKTNAQRRKEMLDACEVLVRRYESIVGYYWSDIGKTTQCPLCDLYFWRGGAACRMCPVSNGIELNCVKFRSSKRMYALQKKHFGKVEVVYDSTIDRQYKEFTDRARFYRDYVIPIIEALPLDRFSPDSWP